MSLTDWRRDRRPHARHLAGVLPIACSAMLLAACGAQAERDDALGHGSDTASAGSRRADEHITQRRTAISRRDR